MRIQRRTRVHRPPSGLGRSGFTLIECLVVVSILGVLAALILVAVQGARESGRRLQCLNNLKQIGLAFASYESTHRVYPSVQPRSRDRLANHFSPVARILSELDQRAVFHSLNFQVAQGHNEAAPDNRTAGRAVLGVFLCPSDGGTLVTFGGRCNIRVNQGASLGSFPQKYEPARSGPFQFEDWVSSASVRDGLSHTALASERLTGNGDLRSRDFTRNTRFAWMQERMSGVTTEALVVHCATPREEDFAFYALGGHSWLISAYNTTSYNHLRPPNTRAADCATADPNYGLQGFSDSGSYAARSHHGGGVNVALADGSARLVADGIAEAVWRALGTIAGGDQAEP